MMAKDLRRHKSSTVCVRCLNAVTTDDSILYFFSNKKRNHGGPVDNVQRSPDKSAALIHFKSHKDAEGVVAKGDHTLDGSRLQVTLDSKFDKADEHDEHATSSNHFAINKAVSRTSGSTSSSPAARRQNTPGNSISSSASGEGRDTRRGGCVGWSAHSGQHTEVWDRRPEPGRGDSTSQITDFYSDIAERDLKRNPLHSLAESKSAGTDHRGQDGPVQTFQHSRGYYNSSPTPKVPRSEVQQEQPSSSSTARDTKIMIPAVTVQKITGDHSLLRNLTMTLKKVDGRFRWKQPNHIIITCLADNPPDDWDNVVAAQIQTFIKPLMQVDQSLAAEEKDQAECSKKAPRTPPSPVGSSAPKRIHLSTKQEPCGSVSPSAKRQVRMSVPVHIKQRITEDRSTLRSLTMALKEVNGKFRWQPKHISIDCTVDNPSQDWERLVTEQVNNFIQEVERELSK
ncbi:uncharacterized protein [Littorina saxatilis]|uniref:RRM domain-containing protein n=2 Tax=Littorina saxatilis TaxID=31220 RepID=A0AAN9BVM9_9CAEN